MGARTGIGWAGGNHLTPKLPLVFGTPSTDGRQLELAEEERPMCGNAGRGLPGLPGSAGRRAPLAFFPSLSPATILP
jgi:hypothetical protein